MIDWLKKANEVLKAVDTPSLATSAKGISRVVTVHGVLEKNIFTWRSLPTRHHSKHVAQNPRIAFNFFDSSTFQSLYGIGKVTSTKKEEDNFIRYYAHIEELWLVVNQKADGKYLEPQPINPEDL